MDEIPEIPHPGALSALFSALDREVQGEQKFEER